MQRLNKQSAVWALLLSLAICFPFIDCFAQNSAPIEDSLRGIGNPQFPTAFWVGDSDYRHTGDKLFWLSADRVATTFFKEFCCRSGSNRGAKYLAAVFDTSGKTVSQHEWISMSNDPFRVGGGLGHFLAQHRDRLDVLREDFTVAGQLSLAKASRSILSSHGSQVALQDGRVLSVYELGNLSTATSLTLPSETRAVDVHGDAVLLNSSETKDGSCYIGVLRSANGLSWIDNPIAQLVGKCVQRVRGIALLSANAALVLDRAELKVVYSDGTLKPVPAQGFPIGIADSGRVALLDFHPSALMRDLDLDYGGHKEVTVYDVPAKTVLLHRNFGAKAGAALSPDGHHLAVIDDHKLLIYALP